MITAWLTARGFLGLAKGLWVLIAIAALLGLYLWLDSREAADDTHNQEIGATAEREGALQETVKRTEQGNEAREAIQQAGPIGDQLRYDQCMRSARTPANCQRFLPQRQAP